MSTEQQSHVCPPHVAKWLNSPLRTLLENPRRLLRGLVTAGNTAVDLGCGGGIFSIALAKAVGPKGQVIAVDLQEEMLAMTRDFGRKKGVLDRITLHKCEATDLGLRDVAADFVLAMHVVHETPDQERFLMQAAELMKTGAHLLLLEPKFHVGQSAFRDTVGWAESHGLKAVKPSGTLFSRGMSLVRT